MTGEGIGQALLTGVLAAEADRRRRARRAAACRGALRAATSRDALVADHRMSLLLIRALQPPQGRPGRGAASPAPPPWTRRNFARWLFEDYPRAVVATPRRWHRGMFTGPGAYR